MKPTWQDKPTEDGYYWLKKDDDNPEIVQLYRFRDSVEQIVWYHGTQEDENLSSVTGKWYGPITAPKDK